MAETDITFEVWTLPSTGSFTKRSEITRKVVSYTLTAKWVDIDDGTVVLDGNSLNLDDILLIDESDHSNDVGSVIRVLRDGTPILHYVATRLEQPYESDNPLIPMTLQGMEWFLDRAKVQRLDDGTVPSTDPDHHYGAPSILKNSSGEMTNELQEITLTGATTGTYTLGDGTDTTSSIAYDASASTIQTRLETDITGIVDVMVRGDGALKSPYQIEFVDPTSYDVLAVDTNSTDGTITIDEARDGGAPNERPWTRSYNPVNQIEHGNYEGFQLVADPYFSGTYCLEIDLGPVRYAGDYGGAQQIVTVRPSALYRASIRVYAPDNARSFRLVIRDLSNNLIATSGDVSAPADTITTLETGQFYTPDNVTQVIFRIGIINSNIDPVYIDTETALLAPGKPADTLGFIMNDLIGPMQTRGVIDWINPTWSATSDSSNAAWDQDLSWTIKRGQSVLQLLEYAKRWGYEWEIEWNEGSSEFDWHMWNSGNGGTAQSGVITGRGATVGANPIVRRLPDFNHAEAEGDQGYYGESNDSSSQSALGRLERYFGNKTGSDATELQGLAGQMITDSLTRSAGRRVRMQNPTSVTPFTDFKPGDTIGLNLEPLETQSTQEVAGVTLSLDDDSLPSYDIHFTSLVYDAETSLTNTVRTLVRKFEGLENAAPDSAFFSTVDPTVVSSPESNQGTGAYAHLSRAATQSISSTGDDIQWDTESAIIPQSGF